MGSGDFDLIYPSHDSYVREITGFAACCISIPLSPTQTGCFSYHYRVECGSHRFDEAESRIVGQVNRRRKLDADEIDSALRAIHES